MQASDRISEEIEVEISDKDMLEINNFLTHAAFVPIENVQALLDVPVHASNINQDKIGNCYLLAALSSIVERDSYYLKNIISTNKDGTVKIKLHDPNDPNIVYTYKINPTKVEHTIMNQHSHDLIFLLEKAFALHRYLHGRKQQTETEIEVIDELQRQKLDIDKTLEALKNNNIRRLDHKFFTKKDIQNIQKEHKLNYNSALSGGRPDEAYTALLGVPAIKYSFLFKKNDYEFYFYEFMTALIQIKIENNSTNSLPENIKEIILEMFGSYDSPEFINLLNNMNFFVLNKALETLDDFKRKHSKTNKVSKRNLLIEFFSNIDGLETNTKQKISSYIQAHIAMPKGYGSYSQEQEDTYKMIKAKLIQGQLISISSREFVGKKAKGSHLFANEVISKGLAGRHAYQVVSAYERDGLKYILVRNPWGEYVRDYEKKKKNYRPC